MQALGPALLNAALLIGTQAVIARLRGPVEGPRLSDRSIQSNTLGTSLKIVYGRMKVAGVLIWMENDEIKEHKDTDSSFLGGKTVTYTYSASFAVAICEGPVQEIRQAWADQNIVWSDVAADDPCRVDADPCAEVLNKLNVSYATWAQF